MPASKFLFTLGLIVMCAALGLDQLSKWLIVTDFISNKRHIIEILPVFNIVLVWNFGISFGMFAGAHQPLILAGISALILIILLIWLCKNTYPSAALALGLIMGGAIGNVLDRLRFGAVVDFLDFHYGAYHWPAFNVADSCIFIGVVLLCGGSMLPPRQPPS